jgi:fucose 4-O-acetylase-like acetyltransferase
MELLYLFYKALPVFWWISVWGLTEMIIEHLISNKKEWRIVFYVGMITIVLGVLYLDKDAIEHI